MNARWLSAGTKVEFELFNETDKKIGKTYTGEFFDIIDDMDIIIFSPELAPLPPIFSKKIIVKAKFFHVMHGHLNFTGTLVRKDTNKNGIKFHIKIDDDFQKIQKREYFRCVCFLKTNYRFLKEEKNRENSTQEALYKQTMTINISFHGLCILVDKNDSAVLDDLVDLTIWLKDDLSIHVEAKIVNLIEYEKNRLRAGLSITYINEKDSAALTKFITRGVMDSSLFWGETP